jgi:hypothetical protein
MTFWLDLVEPSPRCRAIPSGAAKPIVSPSGRRGTGCSKSHQRQGFEYWDSRNANELFGEVAVAASYLFEELDRQKVLTSPKMPLPEQDKDE